MSANQPVCLALAVCVYALGSISLARPAQAQDGSPGGVDAAAPGTAPAGEVSPWSQGVSAEQQRRAGELVDKAHQLHVNFQFLEAAETYQAALEQWAHPAIHLALGRVYVSLVKPLLAHHHLRQAVRFGPKPLPEGAYDAARADIQRVAAQLAAVQITCDQPDTAIKLNGKPVAGCSNPDGELLLPDVYTVTADKPGFFPVTRTFTLLPGKRTVVAIQLIPVSESTEVKRRWQRWRPWAVFGAGAAVGALGGGLLFQAARDYAAADEEFATTCGQNPTCVPDEPSARQRAIWESRIGTGALVIGAAGLAAGLALVIINRPRVYRNERRGGASFEIKPMLTSGSAGVSSTLRF